MSSAVSPTHSSFLNSKGAYITSPRSSRPAANASNWPAVPLSSSALAAEADAPLNLGLDEEEEVWKGESVGLGFGLLGRLKDKTNALLEAIDWDCKICGKTATDPCVTRCGHLFCWSHLTKYLSKYPSCPTCATSLSIDRDAVQVFGRPKFLPSDAPWTSANQTPGSRGSAVSQNSIPNPRDLAFSLARQGSDASTTSLGLEAGNNLDSEANAAASLPPPPASPVDPASRSLSQTDSQSSSSRKNTSSEQHQQQQSRRKEHKPLTIITNSHDGPNILVTSESPLSMSATDRPFGEINLNDDSEDNNSNRSTWRRHSESSTAMPSTSTTRRPSQVPIAKESLRPPSPQLRTKPFRPGWASRQSERRSAASASTDSFDAHVRQSVEVKFTRGLGSSFENPSYDDEGSDGEERDAIYLHSPALKKAEIASIREAGVSEILSPMPQYGWKLKMDGWSTYAPSQAAPPSPAPEDAPLLPESDLKHRAEGRQFYKDTYSRRQKNGAQTTATTVAGKSEVKTGRKTEEHFNKLKSAVEKATKEEATVTGDTIGRALCVFAVVLLVKILIK